jgi:hypoxanthine phosphoribosyltransferase
MANTGPFAQFQNCGDDEESIAQLLLQLLRRLPYSEPDRDAIRVQVAVFRQSVSKLVGDSAGKALQAENIPGSPTFEQLCAYLQASSTKMLRERWRPAVAVGIGRGGAVCAGILCARLGRMPLKVVDLVEKTATKSRLDLTSLCDDSLRGQNVLVVEYTRHTGASFQVVQNKLDQLGVKDYRSLAVYCLHECPIKPNYFGNSLREPLEAPWDIL